MTPPVGGPRPATGAPPEAAARPRLRSATGAAAGAACSDMTAALGSDASRLGGDRAGPFSGVVGVMVGGVVAAKRVAGWSG